MKVGLLRHFKVARQAPKYCNSEEYDKVCADYDGKDIIPAAVNISATEYPTCYSSSLKRAAETARLVYDNKIIFSDELVEIPVRAVFKTGIRLPFKLWNIINRVGWLFNCKNVPETKHQSRERAIRFLNKVLNSNNETNGNQNILIVSHGLFMVTLQIELSKMGFKGQEFFRAGNGELYEFKKP
ncbi:MAG: histidine phosphatase family protein [bacterium]|nr:histidine phosphatase family protein [bacterium]